MYGHTKDVKRLLNKYLSENLPESMVDENIEEIIDNLVNLLLDASYQIDLLYQELSSCPDEYVDDYDF